MSNTALTWARKSRGLTPTQKLVLFVLADAADKDHICWNAAASIAAETGLSDRGVRMALHDLIEAGAISGEMRSGVRPNWTLAVQEGGTTFNEKRNGLPVSKRNHVPTNRKGFPISNRNHVPSEPEPRSDKPEPPSVEPEPGSDEPSITLIEPSLNPQGASAPTRRVQVSIELPEWLPIDAWADWCQHRKGRKWTQRSAELSLKQLDQFRHAGDDPRAVIEQSIASGYQGLFRLKGGSTATAARRDDAHSRRSANFDALAEMEGYKFG